MEQTQTAHSMTPRRMFVAHSIIFVILFGSLGCIIGDKEFWPLSNYDMYSRIYKKKFSYPIIYGVTEGGEIRLSSSRYWNPLDGSRIRKALERMGNYPHPRERQWRAVQFLADYYEKRRLMRLHEGPPIQGIRIYEYTWKLMPGVDNVENPESRRLLGEVMFDFGKGEE